MSHDRGCPCGKEKYEYDDCRKESCTRRPQPAVAVASAASAPVPPREADNGEMPWTHPGFEEREIQHLSHSYPLSPREADNGEMPWTAPRRDVSVKVNGGRSVGFSDWPSQHDHPGADVKTNLSGPGLPRRGEQSFSEDFAHIQTHGKFKPFNPVLPEVHPATDRWDVHFLTLAAITASMSKDPSTKCGAVIVRPDKTVCSMGFNGFPRGMRDDDDYYADRDMKYPRVVHAEMNAILSAHEPVKGYTMYTWPPGTGPSCDRCAVHIIQSGISRIVFLAAPGGSSFASRWSEAGHRGLIFYQEAGVEVVKIARREGF